MMRVQAGHQIQQEETMGIFDQVKQAMQMRNEAKRIQAEIETSSVPYENGGI